MEITRQPRTLPDGRGTELRTTTAPKGIAAERVGIGAIAVLALVTIITLDVVVAKFARESARLPVAVADLFARGSVIPLVFLGLSIAAAIEFDRLLRLKQAQPHRAFAILMISLLMVSPWLSAAGWFGSNSAAVEGLHWQLVWLSIAFVGALMLTVLRGQTEAALRDTGATILMIVYLGFLPSFALQLRCNRNMADQDGAWLILMVLLITKASDIGGYLIGSSFGRHKLQPSISPGKSVEGAIGGALLSALIAVFFVSAPSIAVGIIKLLGFDPGHEKAAVFVGAVETITRALSGAAESAIWWKHVTLDVIFGVMLSTSAQFGDLVESCFKRDVGAKDSSTLIPKAGGILDMIDSPLTAMPVAWIWLTTIGSF